MSEILWYLRLPFVLFFTVAFFIVLLMVYAVSFVFRMSPRDLEDDFIAIMQHMWKFPDDCE